MNFGMLSGRAIVIAIVLLALFLIGSLVIAVATVDLRPWLERAASASLGRATHIGSLQIEMGSSHKGRSSRH